jgi:sulfatase maturation enzyme AslB (radical SAM superfamily)
MHEPGEIFPIKQLQGKYCLSPFVSLTVDVRGNAALCGCFFWMPIQIGNLLKTPLQDLLKSKLAQDIRQSIISGTYEFCNEKTCGVINNNQLNTIESIPPNILPLLEDAEKFIMPYEIAFAGDLTCNLSCPSCRSRVIKISEDQAAEQQRIGNILSQNIFGTATDQPITLRLSTSGELFASPMLLNFVSSIEYDKFPNLKLEVQTNGLLCEKFWYKLGAAESRITSITITFDAARPETYEILRRGGKWKDLLAAMKFLSDKKRNTGIIFNTRMVVQRQNYQEILEFYNFSLEHNADRIEFIRLADWGVYGSKFFDEDVLDATHPDFLQAQHLLSQVSNLPRTWFAGGIDLTTNSST